jgi:hypothetical protein
MITTNSLPSLLSQHHYHNNEDDAAHTRKTKLSIVIPPQSCAQMKLHTHALAFEEDPNELNGPAVVPSPSPSPSSSPSRVCVRVLCVCECLHLNLISCYIYSIHRLLEPNFAHMCRLLSSPLVCVGVCVCGCLCSVCVYVFVCMRV